MTISDGAIVGWIGLAFGTLSSVVGVLWRASIKRIDNEIKELKRRCDACEIHRDELIERVNKLTPAAALLQHCPLDECPMHPDAPRRKTTRIMTRPRAPDSAQDLPPPALA